METLRLPFTSDNKEPQDFFEKYKPYILAATLLIFGLGLYLIFSPPKSTLTPSNTTLPADENSTSPISAASTPAPSGQIVVDIAGGVNRPGVYYLAGTSIIEDAISLAGGFSTIADNDAVARSINRAEKLNDHTKIYIPKKGDGNIVFTSTGTTAKSSGGTSAININSADNTELELLPGVGPITAQRIVDYRLQHSGFKTIEELKEVPGISDGKFDQMKTLVTI